MPFNCTKKVPTRTFVFAIISADKEKGCCVNMLEIIVLVLFVVKEKNRRVHWAGKVVLDMALYFAACVMLEYFTAQTIIVACIVSIIYLSFRIFSISESRKSRTHRKIMYS